jgi:hypothetical protein
LGDLVETALTSVGITKERWVAAKEIIGMPPACDCEDRKLYLNKLGEQLGDMAKSAVASLWPAPTEAYRFEKGQAVPIDPNTLDETPDKPVQ